MRAPKHVTTARRPLFHTEKAAMSRVVPVQPNVAAGVQAVPSWAPNYGHARHLLVIKRNPDGTTQYILEPTS